MLYFEMNVSYLTLTNKQASDIIMTNLYYLPFCTEDQWAFIFLGTNKLAMASVLSCLFTAPEIYPHSLFVDFLFRGSNLRSFDGGSEGLFDYQFASDSFDAHGKDYSPDFFKENYEIRMRLSLSLALFVAVNRKIRII